MRAIYYVALRKSATFDDEHFMRQKKLASEYGGRYMAALAPTKETPKLPAGFLFVSEVRAREFEAVNDAVPMEQVN